MARILFLDADGICHPSPPHSGLGRLCWLPLLAELVEPHTDVSVVLHSSWRFDMAETFLKQLFAPLGERYLGVTRGPGRYQSILRYVAEHAVKDYRIVDDMPGEFPTPAPAELVLCDGRLGITDPRAQARLAAWLRGEPEPELPETDTAPNRWNLLDDERAD